MTVHQFLRALAALLLVVTAATACTSGEPGTKSQAEVEAIHSSGLKTPSAPPTTTTNSAPATPAKSPRGNIMKTVGQAAGLSDASGKTMMTFTLDKVTVDPKCSSPYAEKAKHGHYVSLAFTVKTTTDLTADSGIYGLTQHDFDIVGADGITESEVSSYTLCMNNDEYLTSDPFAPASQYGGLIVLDTKHTTGTIVFRPPGMTGNGGWE
ncbi:MAG: hypothetical protein M3443_10665, partial [Actinomycetota bacterium]|nr:hypothetical protein [Actinomycetota bacterium]